MKIVIGCDEAAFDMKEAVHQRLKELQYDVIDVGVSGQMLEDKAAGIVFPAVFTSGHPSSCLHAERYMYWLFALVHDDGQYPSAVVLRYVTPF